MAAAAPGPLEQRIEQVTVVSGEGEYLADFQRDGNAWVMVEEVLDEENLLTGEQSRTKLRSLKDGIEDFATRFYGVQEVKVTGAESGEIVSWIRDALPEDQDSILVNGDAFELYPED